MAIEAQVTALEQALASVEKFRCAEMGSQVFRALEALESAVRQARAQIQKDQELETAAAESGPEAPAEA